MLIMDALLLNKQPLEWLSSLKVQQIASALVQQIRIPYTA